MMIKEALANIRQDFDNTKPAALKVTTAHLLNGLN